MVVLGVEVASSNAARVILVVTAVDWQPPFFAAIVLQLKGGSFVYKYAQVHLLCALACSTTAPGRLRLTFRSLSRSSLTVISSPRRLMGSTSPTIGATSFGADISTDGYGEEGGDDRDYGRIL